MSHNDTKKNLNQSKIIPSNGFYVLNGSLVNNSSLLAITPDQVVCYVNDIWKLVYMLQMVWFGSVLWHINPSG